MVASRRRIADSAMRLFLRDGYVATSVAAIADEADVAVQTVYNTVGSKAGVLNLVLDATAAGDRSPTPVATFMEQRTSALGSADEIVELLADWFAEVHPRIADVFRIIHEAAAVDPEIAQLRARREASRLDNYHRAATAILERGGGGGADQGEIAATIFSLGHPVTYAMLVDDRGWRIQQYRDWLARALHGCLSSRPDRPGTAAPPP